MENCPTIMPDGITIGTFKIYFYGILIMVGVLAAAWITTRELKRKGVGTEMVWDGLPWVVIAGIIGARLWHVFTPTPTDIANGITTEYYLTHPLALIDIRQGGLGIPGAVIGGALAVWIIARIKKIDFFVITDSVAPGLALAQAIGRWGNFFNQELYGAPTDLPWALYIEPCKRLPGFENIERFHPLFLYEALWNLGGMALMLWLGRRFERRLKTGDIFLSYLIIYPVGRFLLEFLRLNSAQIAGINFNQWFMAAVALIAAAAIVVRHKYGRRVETTSIIEDNIEESEKESDV